MKPDAYPRARIDIQDLLGLDGFDQDHLGAGKNGQGHDLVDFATEFPHVWVSNPLQLQVVNDGKGKRDHFRADFKLFGAMIAVQQSHIL
nr:hypothetical protein [Desulfosarcina cetonica]